MSPLTPSMLKWPLVFPPINVYRIAAFDPESASVALICRGNQVLHLRNPALGRNEYQKLNLARHLGYYRILHPVDVLWNMNGVCPVAELRVVIVDVENGDLDNGRSRPLIGQRLRLVDGLDRQRVVLA